MGVLTWKRNRYRARLRLAVWKLFLGTFQIPILLEVKEENDSRVAKFLRGGIQLSILGQVTQELKDIEVGTPAALEQILSMKQSGVSGHDVGNQIVTFYRTQV